MSNQDFNWTTEDETAWEVESAETTPAYNQRWTVLIVLIAILLGGGIYWQLQRRAETVAADIETDVRSSVDLVFSASAAQDLELFKNMLSGRDLFWAGTQQRIVKENGLLDRSAFGLLGDNVPQVASVVLSPDLFSAEITLTVPYSNTTLQLPVTFRKGVNNWLYAPPTDEFWGDEVIKESVYLITRYPERDTAVIERLSADLEELIRQSGTVEFGFYPPEQQIQITFSTDPETLSTPPPITLTHVLELPTPSLIGLPTNTTGYQTLFNFYAQYVYAPIYASQHSYVCCDQTLYFQALYQWELAHLGIQPWPLQSHERQQLLDTQHKFSTYAGGWHHPNDSSVTVEERLFALALIEFAAQSQYATETPVARRLQLSNKELTFEVWAAALLDEMTRAINDDALDEALFAFLQSWQRNAQSSATPAETLVTACTDTEESGVLYHYDWQAEAWETLSSLPQPPTYIQSLPAQDGLWIGQGHLSAAMWRSGAVTSMPERLRYFGVHSPDGNTLATVRIGRNGQATNTEMALVGLDRCSAESCPTIGARLGQVHWSSDGQHQLIRDFQNQRTTVVDNTGQLVKSLGVSPQDGMAVWIDAASVAWLDGKDRYVRSAIDSDVVEPWIGLEDFRPILPTSPIETPTLRIHDAGHTQSPNLKIVQLYNDVTPRHVIMLDPTTNTTTYIPELDDTFFLTASPNGRWLAGAAFDNDNSNSRLTELVLYNRENGTATRYPYNGASRIMFLNSTDEWAIISEREQIRLIAPERDYVRHILPPATNCTITTWLDAQ